jgi:hypothetical protein
MIKVWSRLMSIVEAGRWCWCAVWRWWHLKRSLANLAAGTVDNLAALARTRLSRMQYIPGLVKGFLTGTGLKPP